MKFEHTAEGITFVWHGGNYIDLYWEDAYRLRGEDAAPFTADNVWDYGKDAPTIERTQAAFEAECAEWLANNREDLNKHLENSA